MAFYSCPYGLLVPGNVVKQKVAEASNVTGTTGSREGSEGRNQENQPSVSLQCPDLNVWGPGK